MLFHTVTHRKDLTRRLVQRRHIVRRCRRRCPENVRKHILATVHRDVRLAYEVKARMLP